MLSVRDQKGPGIDLILRFSFQPQRFSNDELGDPRLIVHRQVSDTVRQERERHWSTGRHDRGWEQLDGVADSLTVRPGENLEWRCVHGEP